MTTAKQAEYLTAHGWKRDGEHWRDKLTTYAWETSAAIKQQRWRDGEARKANGNSQGTIHRELRTNR